MKPAQFRYERPTRLEDALAYLGEDPDDTKVLAGGQSLVPLMNFRLVSPRRLVDLNAVAGLSGISTGDGALRIGAITRMRALERSEEARRALPVIAEAARWVGHVQIRNRGTVGGSLVHADPAAEVAAVCTLCDAEVRLVGPAGERVVAADRFFTGFLSTDIRPDEILTEVRIPCPQDQIGWGFAEFAYRSGDFALAGVACILSRSSRARMVAFGPTERAVRCAEAEALLDVGVPSEHTIEQAAAAAAAETMRHLNSDVAEVAHKFGLVRPMALRALRQASAAAA